MGGSESKHGQNHTSEQPVPTPRSKLTELERRGVAAAFQTMGGSSEPIGIGLEAFDKHMRLPHAVSFGLFKHCGNGRESLSQDDLESLFFQVSRSPGRSKYIFEALLRGLPPSEVIHLLCGVALSLGPEFLGEEISDDPEAAAKVLAPSDDLVEAMTRQALGNEPPTDPTGVRDALLKWAAVDAPKLTASLSVWVEQKLVVEGTAHEDGEDEKAAAVQLAVAEVMPEFSAESTCLNRSARWVIGQWLGNKQTYAELIYSGATQGLSFNRFKHHVGGYRGPTLIVVATAKGRTLTFFSEDEWKESASFFGSGQCWLGSISPSVAWLPAQAASSNYMYMRSQAKPGQPAGIGVGGEIGKFRFFVDSNFETVAASASNCHSFPTRPSERIFDFGEDALVEIEVWGFGGEAARSAQKALQDRRKRMANRERTVDRGLMFGTKKNAWEDNPDRAILGMMGIANHSDTAGIKRDE